MRALLDSQATLWVLDDSPRLGSRTRAELRQATAVSVSAATIWELTIKAMLGKLTVPAGLTASVREAGLRILAVHGDDAESIRDFPQIARHDPFDRIIVGQAHRRGLVLYTADHVLLELGLSSIRDAQR